MPLELDSRLLFWVLFVGLGLLCTVAELIRPARPLNYRAVIKNDLAALLLYEFLFAPAAAYLSASLVSPDRFVFPALLDLPLPLRVGLYYVLADLGSYWMHRLMHGRHVWRVHRWHHSPPYLYWLAGIRATLPQQFLFSLPFVFWAPLLHHLPVWLVPVILAHGLFLNDWMHMNVTWRSRWLEVVFVTPRYHHVHHSTSAEHYTANLGALLTIWDRMFGTYVDPETARPVSFGIDTVPSPARLVLGV